MAGASHAGGNPPEQINWAEQFLVKLSRDMDEIKGMETRLLDRMDRMDSRMNRMNSELNGRIDQVNSRMNQMNDELNNRMNQMNNELNAKIDSSNKHSQILSVTMMIGILAAILTIVIAFGKQSGLMNP